MERVLAAIGVVALTLGACAAVGFGVLALLARAMSDDPSQR